MLNFVSLENETFLIKSNSSRKSNSDLVYSKHVWDKSFGLTLFV